MEGLLGPLEELHAIWRHLDILRLLVQQEEEPGDVTHDIPLPRSGSEEWLIRVCTQAVTHLTR